MANFDFRTYVAKYRPSDPLFITEILQHNIRNAMETFYKHIRFVNMDIQNMNSFETPCVDIFGNNTKILENTKQPQEQKNKTNENET